MDHLVLHLVQMVLDHGRGIHGGKVDGAGMGGKVRDEEVREGMVRDGGVEGEEEEGKARDDDGDDDERTVHVVEGEVGDSATPQEYAHRHHPLAGERSG